MEIKQVAEVLAPAGPDAPTLNALVPNESAELGAVCLILRFLTR